MPDGYGAHLRGGFAHKALSKRPTVSPPYLNGADLGTRQKLGGAGMSPESGTGWACERRQGNLGTRLCRANRKSALEYEPLRVAPIL